MTKDLEKKWRFYARRILKREMGKALISPDKLSKKLGTNAESIRIKLRREAFSAGFFLMVLDILKVKNIDLEEIKRLEKEEEEETEE